MLLCDIVLLILAGLVTASQQALSAAPNTLSSISWKSCGHLGLHNLECGRLSVPLDYANPSTGTASLSILRLLADPKRRRGSLFTNFGGPGVPGTGDWMRIRAPEMMKQSGGEYDIVSWDIRGVNDTTPGIKCFDSQEVADKFWAGSLWYKGVETNSSLRSSFDRNYFYSHVDSEDARLRALWKRCESLSGDVLPYVGTAANARDVASMADAIDGASSEINYWGFSYGSVLGQYITALFPDRLGKIIIDGVVYAPKWSVEPAVDLYNKLLTDTDKTYDGFVNLCAKAGPDGCALASANSTQSSIKSDIEGLLLALYDPHYSTLPKELSRSSTVKFEIFMSLQTPRSWSQLAEYLRSQKDLVKAAGGASELLAIDAVVRARDALQRVTILERHELKLYRDSEFYSNYWSIICSDAPDDDGTTTLDLFDTIVQARERSTLFGPMWPTEGSWPCHRTMVRAAERVTNFRVKPKHPVLILSNVYDPITPIENGVEVLHKSFSKGDAGLGIRDGYGHCSYNMKSPCIVKVIQAYMRNWTLPVIDMKACPTEENLFPSKSML